MREIGVDQLHDIARGAAILGSGGGGDPYIGTLVAMQAIRASGPVRLVSPDEIPDDAVVIPTASIGAPTVTIEKLPAGHELANALRAVERHIGRSATHTVPIEVGGFNSMDPIAAAAELGLPLVDADGMGRAFPEVQMTIPSLAGISASPMSVADEHGNAVIFDAVTNEQAESFARGTLEKMGGSAATSLYALTGRQVKDHMVHGTLSLCQRVGAAIREARAAHIDPVGAVVAVLGGRLLLHGKIVDVLRATSGGFVRGTTSIAGVGVDGASELRVDFQNENLVAIAGDHVLASVPDLISILDSETGEAVTTEMLRYGLRVSVVASPCDARWRTPEGLAKVGPGYFGYSHEYVPI
jgi:DUF917 family protein